MGTNYTREDVVKNDFLFVSYKHADEKAVTETIEFLFSHGVRLWYDADLVTGDNWAKIAEGLIKHENCKGVIFFNSEDSFLSDAVYRERAFTLEKMEKCKAEGVPFYIFPVNLGKPSTLLILKDVFASLPDSAAAIERNFSLTNLESIISLFGSDTIYCYADPEKPGEFKQKLADNIAKTLPSVIDPDSPIGKGKSAPDQNKRNTVSMGICMDSVATGLPEYLLTKEQRIEYRDEIYFVKGGAAYHTKKITWRKICEDETGELYLAETIVDTRNGGDELTTWLNTRFQEIAFTDAEKEKILEIRLLTEADIAGSKDKELLVFEGCDSHWWMGTRAMGALQKVVKKDGSIYNAGYNVRTKKSGVRPVIRIKK